MKLFPFRLLLLCLVVPIVTSAQTGIFYSTDKDISNSLVNCIFQDKRNYIWIATEDGLNKFDGMKFSVYKNSPTDTASLKNNYVRSLFEDSKNRFWVGGISGLQLFNRTSNKFSNVNLYSSNTILQPHITSIIESRDKTIWLSTSGEGVIKLGTGKNDRFEVDARLNSKLPSIHLTFMYEDSYGQLWIGTDNNGLCMYDNESGAIRLFDIKTGNIANNRTSAIVEDYKGDIFVGTLSGGLFKLNRGTWIFESVSYSKSPIPLPIKSLFIDKEKQLLIGTDGLGLKYYNYKTNRIEDYHMSSSIFDFSKVKVHSILQDRAGNLWIGLFQKGIFLLRNNPYRFNYIGNKYHNQDLIGSSCVTAVYKDKNNYQWIGTDNDGMYQLTEDNKVRHFAHVNSPNSISSTVMSIAETKEGEMWLGSYLDGLALFNKSTGSCIYYNDKPANIGNSTFDNNINSMIVDNDDMLWIGTHGGGIYIFDTKTRKYVKHYSFPYITNNWINCLFMDKEGLVWAGTHKGFSIIDNKNNKVKNYSENNDITPGKIIYSIMQDKKDNIWIGTTEGVAIYDVKRKKSSRLTVENGLSSDVICGIVEDVDGNIWMSTHNGISKYNINNKTFSNYFSSDGLQGNEFTRGAFFKTNQGEVFFGGINGLTSFFPVQIREDRESLKLYVTALNIGDRVVFNNTKKRKEGNRFISDLDTIFLDYKDNIFNLEFSTFNYGVAEQIQYRYKMEGLNDTWISTNPGVNRIHFTNINYGTYKLKVLASVRDIQSEIREITIIISPPWYLSGWAITLYVLLGLLLLYGVAGYFLNRAKHRNELMKRQHAEQLNEAKLQFFINISHEIRTPMSLIISPLEKLIPGETDPQKIYLYQIMHRNAKRILRLINQLMDIRKIDKGQLFLQFRETDMVGFINDLMQTFEYLANKRNMDFQFVHEMPELKAWIDLNNMDKVMMNILSNAFKFTPDNGKITVKLSTGFNPEFEAPLNKYFEIVVSDSGIGINESDLENIFTRFYQIDNEYTKSQIGTGVGLHLSRSLVELSHGIIFARSSEENSGSEFVIRLPLGSSHLSEKEKIADFSKSEILAPVHNHQAQEDLFVQEVPEEMTEVKPKTKYRIAIVEDDYEIRNFLKVELKPYLNVEEFHNGKEALQYVLTHKPDLVLSDVMMPEMDGLTLCKKIKTNANVNHIPVILLTAKSTDTDKAEGFETGADAYIPKPFNIKLLTKQILNLIENRRRVEMKPLEEENNKKLLKTEQLKSSDKKLLEKILILINENISNSELNVDFLSKNIGMSRVHMYRKMKELTNQSTHDIIKTIRMKKASEMLSEQKINISEVAYALGFSNLSHFSNVFKEFYGISPKEYAEKHRKQDESELK